MKQKLINQAIFISKSLLWSVLFFVTTMAILNWEELSSAKKNGSPKSWVIKEDGKGKELIPVKVGVNDGISPFMRVLKEINDFL